MKTPRDLLFARHQSTAPKLDALRRDVIARECPTINHVGKAGSINFLAKLWLELIWPSRRIWSGLAVVWVLLLALNISQRESSAVTMAQSSSAADMTMTLNEQKKWLNELLADRALPAEAEPPKNYHPKPRTEITVFLTT